MWKSRIFHILEFFYYYYFFILFNSMSWTFSEFFSLIQADFQNIYHTQLNWVEILRVLSLISHIYRNKYPLQFHYNFTIQSTFFYFVYKWNIIFITTQIWLLFKQNIFWAVYLHFVLMLKQLNYLSSYSFMLSFYRMQHNRGCKHLNCLKSLMDRVT